MDWKEELPDEAGSWAQEAFGVREEEGPGQSSADSPSAKTRGGLLAGQKEHARTHGREQLTPWRERFHTIEGKISKDAPRPKRGPKKEPNSSRGKHQHQSVSGLREEHRAALCLTEEGISLPRFKP
ncbi:unnamed protein product [Rangifer tarandus platyrhynchus]|uniref:Uncharacterized protein n=1 Tax=Rangifer tarandus platyrhynchus TaxID=3082113 RepID=A0AC59Z6W9_RANTA